MFLFTCITKIQFTQQGDGRNLQLTYNFCNEFEAQDSWEDMTNTAKITLPKNVKAIDQFGKPYNLGDVNKNIGGFTDNPLFLRGDLVTIMAGYQGYPINTIFQGYISKVSSKKPFTIECEDNMWVLKHAPVANKVWPAKQYTMEKMLQEMIKTAGLPFTVSILTSTKVTYTIGDFRTQQDTIAQVLERFKRILHFSSYFRGSELRIGSFIYNEQDAINDGQKVFMFQKNIINDELEYVRKDDIELSAIAYSVSSTELATGPKTKDGQTKTKKQRIEVFVYALNGQLKSQIRQPGEKDFAPNTGGERHSFWYENVTAEELVTMAKAELQKYYYDGFRGKFTTFGIPYVRMGDNVTLINNILPEQNGMYKVKSVKYTGGMKGLRQEIQLDYFIEALDAKGDPLPIKI